MVRKTEGLNRLLNNLKHKLKERNQNYRTSRCFQAVSFQRHRCPATGRGGRRGSGRLRLRVFLTFCTMKVVRSSPLSTGRLYPPGLYWYSFLQAESTPWHMVPSVATEKFPSDTTENGSSSDIGPTQKYYTPGTCPVV